MKRKHIIQRVALFLALLMVFQACTVYKSANVTLAQAAEADTKVKVEYNNGEKQKFKRVLMYDNGDYYGTIRSKVNGTWIETKTILNESEISKIWLKNKGLSTFVSIFVPILIVGIVVIISIQEMNNNLPDYIYIQ